jgi:hypothetical protein
MLLIPTFVEFQAVAGKSRTQAGRPYAIYGRPMLIHTYHTTPMLRCGVAFKIRFQNGMVRARHGMPE